MMWNHFDNVSWWWFIVMPLGMLGFWALVAWVIVTLVRGDPGNQPDDDSPEPGRILAERYARGEIDSVGVPRRRAAGVAKGPSPLPTRRARSVGSTADN